MFYVIREVAPIRKICHTHSSLAVELYNGPYSELVQTRAVIKRNIKADSDPASIRDYLLHMVYHVCSRLQA